MSEHTPGPWLLENRGYKFIVSKPGDGYITRDVCRLDGSTMSAFAQEANARLIAGAPDLLEALKALEVLFSPCVRDSTQADWIDRARAAIKAVEGENHAKSI
jgi:hypothetical protein